MGVKAEPPEPFLLFGAAGGTRLEFASATARRRRGRRPSTPATGTATATPTLDGEIRGGKLVIDAKGGDGFISTLLSGVHIETEFGVGFSFAPETGAALPRIRRPRDPDPGRTSRSGPSSSRPSTCAPRSTGPPSRSSSPRGSAPTSARCRRASTGWACWPRCPSPPAAATSGRPTWRLAFKPPTGVGLAIDAGVVTGGGFLCIDPQAGRVRRRARARVRRVPVAQGDRPDHHQDAGRVRPASRCWSSSPRSSRAGSSSASASR